MISVEKALNLRMFTQFGGTSHTDDEVHYVLRFLEEDYRALTESQQCSGFPKEPEYWH